MPEHSSIKVIVTTGDVETVFEIPEVENVVMDINYDEPDIRTIERKLEASPKVKALIFTMQKPISNEKGAYMTITRTENGVVVL